MVDLKAIREKKQLTQQELANKIGCSRSLINELERNSIHPSVTNAKKIADCLGFYWAKFYEE